MEYYNGTFGKPILIDGIVLEFKIEFIMPA